MKLGENARLQQQLERYPVPRSAAFVACVDSILWDYRQARELWQFEREQRGRLELVIKRTANYRRQLKEVIAVCAFPKDLRALYAMPATDDNREADLKLYAAKDVMIRALAGLEEELRTAQGRMAATCLRRRKADPHGLLELIAAAYAKHLEEEPTSTRGGLFYDIAAHVLEHPNVSRAVNAVIRSRKSKGHDSPENLLAYREVTIGP